MVGRYDTLEAAANAEDITSDVFSYDRNRFFDFSSGVDFTVFIDGNTVPKLIESDDETVPDYVVHINVKATSDYDGTSGPVIDGSTLGNDKTNAFFKLNGVYSGDDAKKYILIDNKRIDISNTYQYLDSYFKYNYQTGELYGTPQASGTYTFTIGAYYSDSEFETSYQTFQLNILDNTDENVYEATDVDYDLITPIGKDQNAGKYDFGLSRIMSDQLFVSKRTYGEFTALWINGERMVSGDDYTSESGSTRITIKSQTLNAKLHEGQGNTIAAEFRVNGTNEVRRTAQNVYIHVRNGGGSSGGGSGAVSGGGASGGSYSPENNVPSLIGGSVKGWEAIKAKINGTTSGTLSVDMKGTSLLPQDITAALKGKDVTLRFIMDNGELSINGRTITTARDTGIEIKRASNIPASAGAALAGAVSRTAFTLDNKGELGYAATMKLGLGAANAGLIANLYTTDGTAECIAAVKIDGIGTASFVVRNGGNYAVAIDHISRLNGNANGDLIVNSLDASAILKSSVR